MVASQKGRLSPNSLRIRQLCTEPVFRPGLGRRRPHNPGVMNNRQELDELLARRGAVRFRDHPELSGALRLGVRRGSLVRILPGVIVPTSMTDDQNTRIVAASLWRPGGVLLGRAAARLSFSSRMAVGTVQITGHRATHRPGFDVVEIGIPPEFVRFRGEVPHTDPSLTIVDLLRVGDREPLYEALRSRAVTLASLRSALQLNPGRDGNQVVRHELWLARENPWSVGEAELHEYLRRHGITGWRGNARIEVDGAVYFADALFRRQRLILELDGLEYHTSVIDREYDYRRRAALLAEGYRVMGLTLGMIRTDPERTAERITRARTMRGLR